MRTKFVWLAIAAGMVMVAGTVAVQKASDAIPSPDVQRVVRNYAAALGGRAQVFNVHTREIHGTFEYRGVEQHGIGHVEMRWRAPNSLREQLRGPMGVITRGFDGTEAWGSHPRMGVRRLSAFEIDEILLAGALYQPLGVRHRYGHPRYEGRMYVGGRETEVLSATRLGRRADRFYFDLVSGLPIRLDVWEEGPEAVRQSGDSYLARYELDDYRTVDGVAIPFYVRRVRPNSTMTFRFTEVRQNIALSDSVFRNPSPGLSERRG